MAPSKHLVLVCGFARAGKDTFTKGIIAGSKDAKRLAYADNLKYALMQATHALGLHVNYFDDAEKLQDRDLLVEFGRAMRRRDKDVFAKKICSKMMFDSMRGIRARVVTDWRYLNEYEVAKKYSDEHALSLHTVHIVRHGWKAANEEEAINMQEVLDNVPIDETIFATSGDEQAVHDHGVRIAKLWHL